ncbi:hypothetical protein TRVL_08499 [Trypanosoma vivax]|nr:hypothetical protein TRVL_08499 [Trypanosoma vivax]
MKFTDGCGVRPENVTALERNGEDAELTSQTMCSHLWALCRCPAAPRGVLCTPDTYFCWCCGRTQDTCRMMRACGEAMFAALAGHFILNSCSLAVYFHGATVSMHLICCVLSWHIARALFTHSDYILAWPCCFLVRRA